jgi:hypothetical protein
VSLAARGALNLNVRHQLHGGRKQDVCLVVKVCLSFCRISEV